MNAQDPHAHPLYRPHHGDMTGWRFLEKDEIVKAGDEWVSDKSTIWKGTINDSTDGIKPSINGYTYRRRVTTESKPVEQKRYVTVIISAENQKQFDSAMIALGDSVHRIREGNALALLDGIEERVVKAIREGV